MYFLLMNMANLVYGNKKTADFSRFFVVGVCYTSQKTTLLGIRLPITILYFWKVRLFCRSLH